ESSIVRVRGIICAIPSSEVLADFDWNDSVVCEGQILNVYFSGFGAENYVYFVEAENDTFSILPYGTITFIETGSYNIGLIASNSEQSDTIYKQVNVRSKPFFDVETINSSCFLPTGTAQVVNCNCIDPITVQWSTEEYGEMIDSLLSGFYFAEVIDSNGCGQMKSFDIGSQTIVNFVDTTICPGSQLNLAIVNGDNLDSLDILWSNGQVGNHITVFPTNATSYTVSINTNGVFCTGSVEVHMDYDECPCDIVWNSNDSGEGSLRDAIECSSAGDTIQFAGILEGDTIMINSTQLTLEQDLVIKVDEDLIIVILDNNNGYTFHISPLANVVLENLTVLKNNSNYSIYNEGQLTLKDIILMNNIDLNGSENLIRNLGSLYIVGNVNLSKSNF
ncbi:MAG: hypothetical protein WBP41_05045, partial [Saprospiraceae bacterium]